MSAEAERNAQARAAAFVVLVLAAGGALLGLVWTAWSPPGPFGVIYSGGTQPDETEAWAAADGRFAIIVGIVGLLAGVAAWLLRTVRGPYLVLAIGAGGIAGAGLTAWVGHLVRGSAHTFTCGNDTVVARCTEHLPLTLHMTGLLYLQPALAILVYALLVAFAPQDDLGRPDPVRESVSVQLAAEDDDAWRDGDRAGVPQQSDLPPQ